MHSHRDVESLVLPSRGKFECFDRSTASTIVFAFCVGQDRAAVIEHIRGLAESMSAVETSAMENGVAFSDGSVIAVDRWESTPHLKQADILVLGHSAFDILPDSDRRIYHGLVSGFRYRFSFHITCKDLQFQKQPIAP